MEKITEIAEGLRGIVRLIVDLPDDVQVTPIANGTGFVLEIAVSQKDLGKVIGKMGRTARALRNLIQAVGMTHKIPIALNIDGVAPQEGAFGVEVDASQSVQSSASSDVRLLVD